jgi:hypothetical protein
VSCCELACLARLAWDIFLGAMVISSNDLMIIYSGVVFDCRLVITIWLCFCYAFLVAGAKRKRRRRKEERRCVDFRNKYTCIILFFVVIFFLFTPRL